MRRFHAAIVGAIGCSLLIGRAGAQAATAPAALSTTRPADTQPATAPSPVFAPTADYDSRETEGWHVLINRQLLQQHPKTADQTLQLLHFQLYQIVRRLPPAAVEKLQKVTIWVEFHEGHHPCMVYHPDPRWLVAHDMNPDKAHCVEIADARNFLTWTREQPWMVLHELAHAYHDQFLPRGFGNETVASAYQHAIDEKLYESVLHIFGRREKAYATTNAQEYFAELTESYFGTNDFFPFVRAELKEHDPAGFGMMHAMWED